MIDFLKGKITPRDWIAVALLLGVTAGIVGVFYFLVHEKKQEEITQAQETNSKVKTDLEKARKIHAEIDNYIKETNQIRRLVAEFETRLPTEREITGLIRVFEEMAAAQDIDIELSPLSPVAEDNKETIPYRIEASGDFHSVANFINELERYERYLKVSNLEMEPNEEGMSTFKFTLNTYRFIQTTQE